MTELIPTINEITKYGLEPNLPETHKEILLERNFVKIYDLYFEISYDIDDTEFKQFDKSICSEVRPIVTSNFQSFGLYTIQKPSHQITNALK